MHEILPSWRWLQALTVVQACLSLTVVAFLAHQVLRWELVLLLLLHGVVAALVAIGLFLHVRGALHTAFGFSLLVTVLGLAAVVAIPVPEGMMRETFLLIRGMVLIVFLPSVGSVLICLLTRGLRQALLGPF